MIEQALISNGYTISPDRLGWLIPSNPATPRDTLWEQYQEQGYLWLRGILDRQEVLAFRRRVFQALIEAGLVKAGTDPVEGFYAGPDSKTSVHPNKIYAEVVRWAAYEAFCLSRPIIEFYESLLEGPVYLHKRKLIRHTVPHDPNCTGAHYDLVYLRGGTDRVCTSWIPIGDTAVEMGGLIYLEKSHTLGRSLEASFAQRNADLPPEERVNAFNKNMGENGWLGKDLQMIAERADSRWLMANYEAGDMVIHSAYTIHAATINLDPLGRMRLSTDIRYQRVRDEIDARWSNHWSLDDML